MKLMNKVSRVLAICILFTLALPIGVGAAEKKTCSHKWVLIKSTEPTCTKEGKKVYQCSKCNKQKKEKVKALGHDWAMCMITQKATCTREGITHCICSRNPKHVKNDIIPALGHSWGSWSRIQNSTEEKEGLETRRCGRCGATEKRKIPKLVGKPADKWTLTDAQAVIKAIAEWFKTKIDILLQSIDFVGQS